MASSSSGRYQSRLFNWLSRGFSQLEKVQPRIRRLKIGVAWGVEVVFFSAYRLSQMMWFAGRRLGQTAQQHLSPRFSPRFQAALGRMLAWMPRRLAQPIITRLKARSTTGRQLQESPSSRFGLTTNSESKIQNPKSEIGQALTFLDSVSLQLERRVEQIIRLAQQGLGHKSQNSVPDQTSLRADELGIRGLIRAAIAYFFNHKPLRFFSQSASTQPPILDSDNSVATSISGSQQLSQDSNQPLITGSAKPSAAQQLKKTRQTRRIKPEQEQPWLTMTDLFGGSAKASLASATSGVAAVSMTSRSPQGRLSKSQTPANSDSVATIDTDAQVMSQSYSRVDGDSVDIETEAILMGYVKHPLEQALGWLDQSLAWLEEMIIVLWSHLQPYWAALLKLIRRYWQRYF